MTWIGKSDSSKSILSPTFYIAATRFRCATSTFNGVITTRIQFPAPPLILVRLNRWRAFMRCTFEI